MSKSGSNRAAESVRVFFYLISERQGSVFWVNHENIRFFLLASKKKSENIFTTKFWTHIFCWKIQSNELQHNLLLRTPRQRLKNTSFEPETLIACNCHCVHPPCPCVALASLIAVPISNFCNALLLDQSWLVPAPKKLKNRSNHQWMVGSESHRSPNPNFTQFCA